MNRIPNINLLPDEAGKRDRLFSNPLRKRGSKAQTYAVAILAGVFSLGLISSGTSINAPFADNASTSKAMASNDIVHVIYGDVADSDPGLVNQTLEKQVKFVSSRPAFLPSYNVVKKHETTLRREARAKGIPEDVAIGIAFLENGGAEYATSIAGAAGIVQLMPGTARQMGLTVNAQRDDRRDPEKSIEAGFRYLANNHKIFGDWGIAAWTYHAGEGNGSKAIRAYARANSGIELAGLSEPAALRAYVKNNNLTIHKLLSDPAVQREVTNRLQDDSAGYPYKVMAMAHMYQLSTKMSEQDFLQKVVMLNTNSIKVADLFS